ncbi:hypothetical protein HanPSC8_Chr05g0226891 [Helianthus annuus]|nr:hypothetical protein HanPSC8_Chr05g0226891 [Helianthus annuus]
MLLKSTDLSFGILIVILFAVTEVGGSSSGLEFLKGTEMTVCRVDMGKNGMERVSGFDDVLEDDVDDGFRSCP